MMLTSNRLLLREFEANEKSSLERLALYKGRISCISLRIWGVSFEIFQNSVSIYELYALALIVLATVIRVTLAYQHWPLSNSDEGTMGIMALHIFSHGEHPIFFYGQNYMGATEAYLGAALFHVSGASLFTLD